MYKNTGFKILGTGSYVPEFSVKNSEFEKFVDTSDEWITTRTGIKERYFITGKPNHYMAVKASEKALENAGTDASEIDLIIVSSCSPDFSYPSISCIIQGKIKAENAACIDVNSACTGFVSALDIARNYLLAGKYKKILVTASEKLSSLIDFTDRATCVLFGDGAGAVVLEAADNEYFSFFGAMGEDVNNAYLYYKYPNNNSMPFKTDEEPEENQTVFKKGMQMNGKAVYKFGVEVMQKSVNNVLMQAGITIDEIDVLIPHQANLRIIQTAVKNLKIPMDKVYTNIETHANTSSACIPTCLDELNKDGKLKEGMRVCMVGFGGGLSFGAVLIKI